MHHAMHEADGHQHACRDRAPGSPGCGHLADGGASSVAIATLLVLRADPTIQVVGASSCERDGTNMVPPAGALVHGASTDPEERAMTIVSVVTAPWRDVRCATSGGAHGLAQGRLAHPG